MPPGWMTLGDEKDRYDEVLSRIGRLIKDLPEANTTSLQVMLLQADYSRAEAQIGKWIADRSQTEALGAAGEILARIAPKLDANQKKLNKQLDEMRNAVDAIMNPAQQAAEMQKLRRLAQVAGRATYFAGWSNYYYALSRQQSPEAKEDLVRAKGAFRHFLGLDEDEKYEDIEVSWLQLESLTRSQALIGLGLAEVASSNLDGARSCFKMLDDVSAPPAIRDSAAAYFLQGLLNAGLVADAGEYAAEQIEKFGGNATQGKVSFCVALLRAGFGSAADGMSAEHRRLGEIGVRGLARLRQIGVAQQVLAEYDIELDEADDFYFTWLKGHRQFSAAEKSKSSDDFETAATTLTAALALDDARKDVASSGQCRYTLAWCRYRQARYEEAAEQFEQAVSALKEAGGDAAVESAWMAFASFHQLATKQREYVSRAIAVLESIQRDFPLSEQAKKAEFQIAKLRQAAGSPAETIAALEKIKPDEPSFLSARYDLCRLHHEQWLAANRDAAKAATAAAEVRKAADAYLRAARNDDNDERKLKCLLWAADTAISGPSLEESVAKSYLDRAAPLAEKLPQASSAVAEYHYRLLQLAQKTGDEDAVNEQSQWLANNAKGSVYELAAVINRAREADAAVANASPSERAARVVEAAAVYQRLVEIVGQSSAKIAADKNARVANSKLAGYEYELGRYAEAAQRLERILAAFPDDADYLRRAGLAQYKAGDHDASIEHWRRLTRGLKVNSSEWYEAKYYQLACLRFIDKPAAIEAYRQFRLLHPKADEDPWRSDPAGLRGALK